LILCILITSDWYITVYRQKICIPDNRCVYQICPTIFDKNHKCKRSYCTSITIFPKQSALSGYFGSAFTSHEVEEFMKEHITHIRIATGSPQANGQVERVNCILSPMFAKLFDNENGRQWYKMLEQVKFATNNMVNRFTGKTPCQLLFGADQRGPVIDRLKDLVLKSYTTTFEVLKQDRIILKTSKKCAQKRPKKSLNCKQVKRKTMTKNENRHVSITKES